MRWTIKKPTVEGWYWYGDPRCYKPDMVYVMQDNDGRWVMKGCYSLDDLDGRWAGPMELPKGKLPWEEKKKG